VKPFTVITDALKEAKVPRTWRDRYRPAGDELRDILLELARGRAWTPTLPDGRICEPVVPSSDVRLRAAIALSEMIDGKAVPQTEVVKAEQEARDLEAVRALSDAELEAEAAKILAARRKPALEPGPVEDAEEPVDLDKVVGEIWAAPMTERDLE
jgi:hypothetical protein